MSTEPEETTEATTPAETPLYTTKRPAPEPEVTDTHAQTETPEASEATEDKAPEPQPAETAEPEETKAEKPAVSEATKARRAALLLDSFLVLLLAGAVGGGCWYLNQELGKYRVPSPMEMAAQENVELCKQREDLQAPAYHADEQLHMRKRLSALVIRAEELKRKAEEKKKVIETQHQKVLALQHDIRQEDKTTRSVAKTLLPGLPIGDATTTTGKTYPNAVIYRMEGKKITLRTPDGQMRIPTATLVKENLPDLARYAFGLDDMVDMSDFEVTPDQPAPKARKGKLIPAKATKAPAKADEPTDYEAESGAPVVDTDANRTSTWTAEGEDAPSDAPAGRWQPPSGDLPF